MERSKIQAVFKFLPGMWISYREGSEPAITAEIRNWNYKKVENIYNSFIEAELKRQIKLFGEKGGDISSYSLHDDGQSFCIVEPACNEGVSDIIGKASPLIFYCSSCHHVIDGEKKRINVMGYKQCDKCGSKSVKQLQMVYACECGFASPVKIPFVKGVYDFEYRPTETSFKMFYKSGKNERAVDLHMICSQCGSVLKLDNADSGRNYRPFTMSIINLLDEKSGLFYEKGIEAQKVVIAQWFELIDKETYERVVSNIELSFSEMNTVKAQREEAEKQVRALIAMGFVSEENFEAAVTTALGNKQNTLSVEPYVLKCDELFLDLRATDPVGYLLWVNQIAFNLMQYNTIKYAKRVITLEDSISRHLEMNFIESPDEIMELNRKLGIKSVQVSGDLEILNCTYGYTRKIYNPNDNENKNCRLKLVAYDRDKNSGCNLVFSSKLKTEGILFEIDRVKILEWLLANKKIAEKDMPDTEDDVSVKKWFAEHVNPQMVSLFGGVEDESITKEVFSLLHSISHALLRTAGEVSGLATTSLSEKIFLETTSIFLYAQSSQGIPLGALSGLLEANYVSFLKQAIKDNRYCIFDPICCERDDSACSACLIIPEISCSSFNNNLGRKYLYTLHNEEERVGFWEV